MKAEGVKVVVVGIAVARQRVHSQLVAVRKQVCVKNAKNTTQKLSRV